MTKKGAKEKRGINSDETTPSKKAKVGSEGTSGKAISGAVIKSTDDLDNDPLRVLAETKWGLKVKDVKYEEGMVTKVRFTPYPLSP